MVVVADEQTGEIVANGASCRATMGVDGGKDGRELEGWGNAKRGGWTVLGVPSMERGVLATRLVVLFLSIVFY